MKLRPYQQDAVEGILKSFKDYQSTLAVMATGTGKCFGFDTPIMKFDGTVAPVQEIKAGDLLMGPDSLPRKVTSTCEGDDALYKVTPTKGDPYIVNSEHILSLKITGISNRREKKVYDSTGQHHSSGDIVNINIADYLASTNTFKHVAKGYRAACLFPQKISLPLDPYVFGIWIGDGHVKKTQITTPDREVVNALKAFCQINQLVIKPVADCGKAKTYSIIACNQGAGCNCFRNTLKSLGVFDKKEVPRIYKVASFLDRQQFIAGIIDSDGHLSRNCYDWVNKHKSIANDVAFIARSVGLAAYVKECRKQCVNAGAWGTYYRVSISGNLNIIPCKVRRKQASLREQNKDVLVTGITVEECGYGRYYGFTLLGKDRRFLLGDFTVAHNTATASHIIGLQPKRTMFIAHRSELIHQTRDHLKRAIGIDADIEMASEYANRLYHNPVVVGTVQSLTAGRFKDFVPDNFSLLCIDECHHAVSPSYRRVIDHFKQNPECKVLGLSVGPGSEIELKGGVYKDGFVGHIESAYNIAEQGEIEPYIWNGYEIIELKGVLARGFDGKRFTWKPCQKIIRHATDKPCVKIKYQGGELVCTTDHSIYKLTGEPRSIADIDCPPANDLQVGETLLYDNGSEWGGQQFTMVNMVDFAIENMPKTKVRVCCDVKSLERDALKDHGYNSKQIYQWRKSGTLSPEVFNLFSLEATTMSAEGTRHTSAPFIDITKLAWFFGYYLGNGSVDEKRVLLAVPLHKQKYVEGKIGLLADFDLGVSVRQKQGESIELRINNVFLYHLIENFLGIKKAYNKTIPPGFICSWPEHARRDLLQGLIDSDGHFSKRDQGRESYTLTTTSKAMANGVKTLLRSFNIVPSFRSHPPTKGGVIDGRQIFGKHWRYDIKFSAASWNGDNSGHKGFRTRYDHGDKSFNESKVTKTLPINPLDIPDYVYDLEMKGHPSFVANGILAHNTATPDRSDEEALGQIFDDVAYEYGILDAITDGWLTPIMQNSIYVESLDLSNVGTSMGDFASNQLAQVLEFEENLHGIADPTIKIAGNRQTLIFTASVDQAERLAEIINRHKPGSADFVCGKTPSDVRAKIFDSFQNKDIQFLCNVGIVTEGTDLPGIELIAMARPTKSRCLFTQCIGRGLRPAANIAHKLGSCYSPEERKLMIASSEKPSAEVLDFVGNAGRHKLITTADVLGGKYSDEIVEEVKARTKPGDPVEMMTMLQKVEAEMAKRRRDAIDSAQRDAIKLRSVFSMKSVDPFDVLGIIPCRIPGYDKNREATTNQIKFLSTRNIDASEMNIKHASQLISELKEREKGMFSFGKHAGKTVEEVCSKHKGYVWWWLKQDWSRTKPELRSKCCELLGVAG